MNRFSLGTTRHLAFGLLFVALSGAVASEEDALPVADPSAAEKVQEPIDPSILRYERRNFRDPFRSLEKMGMADRGPRPPGPAGMLIEEVDLVGVLAGPKGAMILIIGSDGLGYSLQEGSDLYDGKVLRIQEEEGLVIFRQEVNDPNRIKPYRDIERRIESAS